jgi:radical SAM protein with 4Fe4S-binding SPASM domain
VETRHPFSLRPKDYALLKSCDGVTDIPESDAIAAWEAMGVVRQCRKGEDSLAECQVREYPNKLVSVLDWTITDRCNYNCLHCFHAADNSMNRCAFTREEAMRFLDEMAECGLKGVRLTGGEPTLHPNFREILEGIRERDLQLRTLITNGSRLDEELVSFIKAVHPYTQVMISFDGIGFHDWLRQHPGAEEQALKAVRLCKQAGLNVAINSNVNRKNRDVLFDSVKMLAELGADTIRLIKTTEAPRWQLNAADDSLTIEEYYDFTLDFAEKYKTSGLAVPVRIWQSLYLNPKRMTFSCYPVKTQTCNYREDFPICTAMHYEKPSVLANGEMVPCAPLAGLYELRNIPKENVKKDGLKKVLTEGSFVSSLTLTVGQKLRENPKCGSCMYAKNCHGGCPAISILYHGSFLGEDDFKCSFFNGGYYEKFCRAMDGWKNLNPL